MSDHIQSDQTQSDQTQPDQTQPDQSDAAWRTATVTSRHGGDLHVWTRSPAGAALGTIVGLHGFSDSGRCLQPLAASWQDRFALVLPDARGHGRSARFDPALPAGFELDDVLDVIEALQLPPVILYGHSMGARTAARFAAREPGHVQAVILEDPPWRSGPPPSPANGRAWFDALKGRSADKLLAMSRRLQPGWPEAEHAPWAESKPQLDENAEALLGALRDRDGMRVVAGIRCPGLLITGNVERDAIVSAETAAEVQVLWPQCRHVYVADAGHNVRREDAATVTAAVGQFLDSLSPAAQ